MLSLTIFERDPRMVPIPRLVSWRVGLQIKSVQVVYSPPTHETEHCKHPEQNT